MPTTPHYGLPDASGSMTIQKQMGTCASIGPSLLSADLANIAVESSRMMRNGADFLHFDIMDGHFAPNLTFGPPVLKSLRKHTDAFIDCHMMVSDPAQWVEPMALAGADSFTFHVEATSAPVALIAQIRAASRPMRVGVAIKPGTPLEALEGLVPLVDYVLAMTVEPGFAGQAFMPTVLPKIAALRAMYPTLDIQVDGGLTLATIDAAAGAGANVIVAGSALFNADELALPVLIAALRERVDPAAEDPLGAHDHDERRAFETIASTRGSARETASATAPERPLRLS